MSKSVPQTYDMLMFTPAHSSAVVLKPRIDGDGEARTRQKRRKLTDVEKRRRVRQGIRTPVHHWHRTNAATWKQAAIANWSRCLGEDTRRCG